MLFLIQREGATMTPEELTQLTTLHQAVLTRHDSEMSEIREMMKLIASQQAANQEAIAHLTASILDLRNVVSDYIQGRS